MAADVDAESLEPLLAIVRLERDAGLRIALLDAMTRFPLGVGAWQACAQAVGTEIRSCAAGSAERRAALELAVRVPLMSVRHRLRAMAEDPGEADAAVVAAALDRAADAEGAPLAPRSPEAGTGAVAPPIASSAAPSAPLTETDDQLVLELLDESPAPDRIDRIASLPGQRFWSLFRQLFDEGNRRAARLASGTPANVAIGNQIVDVVARRPAGELLPVAELVFAHLEAPHPALDDGQFAWIVARAAPAHLIRQLSESMSVATGRSKRSRLVDLLARAADHAAGRGISPWRASGSGAADGATVAVGAGTLIDDLPQAAMAPPAPGAPPPPPPAAAPAPRAPAPPPAAPPPAAPPPAAPPRAARSWWRKAFGIGSHDDDRSDGPADERVGSTADEPVESAADEPMGNTGAEPVRSAEAGAPGPASSEPELRKVHAQIMRDGVRRNTFASGADNLIRCWIGLPEPERAAVAASPIPQVDIPAQGLELSVELCWGDQSDGARLLLPASRSARSGDCDLRIRVPEDEHYVSAEIVFRYRGRIFEAVQVEAFALAPGEVEQPRHQVKVRVQASRREVIELEERQSFDATVIWGPNRSHAGPDDATPSAPSLRVFGGNGGRSFDLEDADVAIRWLNEAVFTTEKSLVRRRAAQGQSEAQASLDDQDADVLALLRDMARHGANLFNQLAEQGFEDPGERLQLLNMDPGAYVPLEFVYDRGYPADDARLCDGWRDALLSDAPTCPACGRLPLSADRGDWVEKICPLGFWSLQKIIERLDPDAVEPSAAPGPGRSSLPAIDSALFASSHRVPADERLATWEALGRSLRKPLLADDWVAWKQALAQHPVLLVVLPHHDVESSLDYLEIGDERLPPRLGHLSRGQLTRQYVNPDDLQPGPIVLLLGCRTGARTEVGYVQLARRFQQLRSSIVLGTLAQILGRHAAPLARELVEQLVAVDDPRADFGTVMRRVRRRMLARGYLMAMCLVALGDAQWHLTPRAAPS